MANADKQFWQIFAFFKTIKGVLYHELPTDAEQAERIDKIFLIFGFCSSANKIKSKKNHRKL
ncbi:hypothetical protein [Moraxella marmotae]|uniref:hypothetical protein n=1 Tax=Moraxella marmotae TaxID=3344520 RepID=UPI0035F3C791